MPEFRALRVWQVGTCLHVANTGAPLDEAGVQALTALRASSKTGGVGRFGVGFTAVLAISDEVEVRSRTGSIRFSAAQTRDVLAEHGSALPDGRVPTLRLVWPSTTAPAAGSDSEVVLDVRSGIDTETLLDDFRREAIDLLLELPALQTIVIDEDEFVRTESILESGLRELRVGDHCWWEHRGASARWLVPVVEGVVRPVHDDVLRAPTRSDEELSLPALVVADVPMQPDRRRMLPGPRSSISSRGTQTSSRPYPVISDSRWCRYRVSRAARSTDASVRHCSMSFAAPGGFPPRAGETISHPTARPR